MNIIIKILTKTIYNLKELQKHLIKLHYLETQNTNPLIKVTGCYNFKCKTPAIKINNKCVRECVAFQNIQFANNLNDIMLTTSCGITVTVCISTHYFHHNHA